jgi:hypothetical protein
VRLLRTLGLLALAMAVPLVQSRIDARQDRWRAQRQALYVGDGRLLRRLLPGFELLAADLYWLRTVQYYGGKLAFEGGVGLDLLYPLADVTTALDPRLEVAYRFGAIFLCEPAPHGAGDCQAGLRLLAKGADNLPGAWGLRQDMGYFRFLYLGDAEGAARELRAAARLPGAPFTLETLAGRLLMDAGRNAAAREIWQQLFEQYPEGYLRENARIHLQKIDGRQMLATLNAAVVRRRAAGGSAVSSAEDLVRLGLDRRLTVDPTGVPFAWDAERQAFWFSRQSRLWELR